MTHTVHVSGFLLGFLFLLLLRYEVPIIGQIDLEVLVGGRLEVYLEDLLNEFLAERVAFDFVEEVRGGALGFLILHLTALIM